MQRANETFVKERQSDSRVSFREKKLNEVERAYWKWREIVGNGEEGIKVSNIAICKHNDAHLWSQFYKGFLDLLVQFRTTVSNWVHGRRTEMA